MLSGSRNTISRPPDSSCMPECSTPRSVCEADDGWRSHCVSLAFGTAGSTATHLGEHVGHHARVFDLWAEEDDLGVHPDAHAVSRWPIEQIIARARLLRVVRVGDDHFPGKHVAPVRRLAGVTL